MNCKTCKTRECEYAELEKFLQYISEAYGKNFEICECPDKNNSDYTCDLVVMDHASQEKIYIEIKEVKFGFEGKHSFHEAIAQNNGKMIPLHFCLRGSQRKQEIILVTTLFLQSKPKRQIR